MKPYWIPTLAWIAAVVAAVLMAFVGPEIVDRWVFGAEISHGAWAPR